MIMCFISPIGPIGSTENDPDSRNVSIQLIFNVGLSNGWWTGRGSTNCERPNILSDARAQA